MYDVYNDEENLIYGVFGDYEEGYDRVAEFLEYKIIDNFYTDEEYGFYLKFKQRDCWCEEDKESELYINLLEESNEY